MQVVVDRLEDDRAVLRTDDGQELVVPLAEFPDGTGEGDVLNVTFGADTKETEHRAASAKDILNEILGSGT